ncbi:hypothetical protein [Haloechinothrix halophila]|uniref:hypothetical protein n=1 Tax=Haloechinothrix halophila TaxID=1069073 RepID=UPI0003F5DF2A|nr:hypothetical protein [Haloechinothrix halophila]
MSTTTNRPSTEHLQHKVWQAWLRLKQARVDCDITTMLEAEGEMNSLLDQLASRKLAAA